jgi:hypothetical protein
MNPKREVLIVKNLKIGDKIINLFSVALEIVDILASDENKNENEVVAMVKSIGREKPKKMVFPKTYGRRIKLNGFQEHIPSKNTLEDVDVFD